MEMPAQSSENPTIRIGTRGSKLALVQAEHVKAMLLDAHKDSGLNVEIEVISTAGDRSQKANTALSEIGGKGLFTEEIEAKLLNGTIDIAVHSSKDMPTALPEGLELVCFPERENPADAFISNNHENFNALPKGATVGSASLRRRALMHRLRPDLDIVMFRGNVDTRLKKIRDGVADATLLAVAGLRRLGLQEAIRSELPVAEFPPAPGQGAVCIEAATDNARALALLEPLNHEQTSVSLTAERAFLRELDGSCRTPIAGLATVSNGKLELYGMILTPDGRQYFDGSEAGTTGDAAEIGIALGRKLKHRAGADFFKDW